MYASYFGFRDIPFRQLSDPQHTFLGEGFLASETELHEAVEAQTPLILLTGHAGTGKTKLLSYLAARLDETRPVFYLPYSALLIEDFIGFVSTSLDIHLPDGSDIFSALQQGFVELAEDGERPVLLVDDAHSLGCDVLENLIGLFQLGAGEEPLAQLVLAAHPEIEYTLERSELRELEENLVRMHRIRPLGSNDVGPYVDYALRVVGYDGEPVFSPEAIEAISTHTRGIPQLINTLCGASFLVAYGRDENPVSANTVEAAIEEVVGLSMVDTIERHTPNMDSFGFEDFESESEGRPLPGMVQAWLRLSRTWPIAAVGVGGSVALVAFLVLFGTLPFDNNSANALPHKMTHAINERISRLNAAVDEANEERDRLRSELDVRIDERDVLAKQLAEIEAIRLTDTPRTEEVLAQNSQQEAFNTAISGESLDEPATAEDLLAELMRTAEIEADLVTSGLVDTVPTIDQVIYKVQAGDTLWMIAERHAMSVEQLRALNDMANTNKLMVGQDLTVNRVPIIASQPLISTTTDVTSEWYVVRPGDSLYGIGRKFESSVDELLAWNQLANADTLQVGQKLRLFPEQP